MSNQNEVSDVKWLDRIRKLENELHILKSESVQEMQPTAVASIKKEKTIARLNKEQLLYKEVLKKEKYKELLKLIEALGGYVFLSEIERFSSKSSSQISRDLSECVKYKLLSNLQIATDFRAVALYKTREVNDANTYTELVKNLFYAHVANYEQPRSTDADHQAVHKEKEQLAYQIDRYSYYLTFLRCIVRAMKKFKDVSTDEVLSAEDINNTAKTCALTFEEYLSLISSEIITSDIGVKKLNLSYTPDYLYRRKVLKMMNDRARSLSEELIKERSLPRGAEAKQFVGALKNNINEWLVKKRKIQDQYELCLKREREFKYQLPLRSASIYNYQENVVNLIDSVRKNKINVAKNNKDLKLNESLKRSVNNLNHEYERYSKYELNSDKYFKEKYKKEREEQIKELNFFELENAGVFMTRELKMLDEFGSNFKIKVYILDYKLNLKDTKLLNLIEQTVNTLNNIANDTTFHIEFVLFAFSDRQEINIDRTLKVYNDAFEIFEDTGDVRALRLYPSSSRKKSVLQAASFIENLEIVNLELNRFFSNSGCEFLPPVVETRRF